MMDGSSLQFVRAEAAALMRAITTIERKARRAGFVELADDLKRTRTRHQNRERVGE